MKRIIKFICSAVVLCGAFSMLAVSAYAEETTNTPEVTAIVSSEKTPLDVAKPIVTEATTGIDNVISEDLKKEVIEKLGVPLGNGILIEDKNDDVVDRQFLTVQSKNGNTFYLIVDKDTKGRENVYFLNMVDEYDLLAFAENFPEEADNKCDKKEPLVTDNNGKPDETEKSDDNKGLIDNKFESKTEGGNNTMLFIVGVLALAGGGAFIYFKFVNGKSSAPKKKDYIEDDDDEYQEETVNENSSD